MPSAALRPCTVPHCPRLSTSGRCELHRQLRQRLADAVRGTAQERGYDAQWARISKAHLQAYPSCGMRPVGAYEGWRGDCFEQKRSTPATCTDHIIPHKGDRRLLLDPLNRQSLCGRCNRVKAIRFENGFGRPKERA